MKKIITLCLFVFGLFLATNNANAQQKFSAEINNAAHTKAVEYGRYLKVNETVQESIFTAYQEFYAKSETLNNKFEAGTSQYTDLKNKINDRLLSQINEVLTEEQYTRFLELSNHTTE